MWWVPVEELLLRVGLLLLLLMALGHLLSMWEQCRRSLLWFPHLGHPWLMENLRLLRESQHLYLCSFRRLR